VQASFIALSQRQQLRCFYDRVQTVKIEHLVLPWACGLVRVQAGVIALQRVQHRPRCAARKNHDLEPVPAQLGRALHRRLAAFDHVGQQGHALGELGASPVHLLVRTQGLNEQRIHTAFQITLSPLQRGVQPLDRHRIGARKDQGIFVLPGVECFTTPAAEPILAALPDYDVVYFSGITLAVLGEIGRERLLHTLVETRRRGGKVVFDNNYRPRLWASVEAAREAYGKVLAEVDMALLTEDDERALFGYASSEQVFAAYPAIAEVVLKRGAQDCLIRFKGERFGVPAVKVEKVVDTTAAGDSFSAAYLASRLKGGSPQEAAVAGHRLASRVIQLPGALIPR